MRGGGAVFPDKAVPGLVVSRNITPQALGDCKDEQIIRAIREGVGCDGTTLFPVMPYHFFRAMSDDDAAAVVAFVRALPAVKHDLPKNRIPDEVWASLPPPEPITGPVAAPPRSDKEAYGRYLATIGLCVECHTPVDQRGAPIPGLAFAGGRILDGPWGRVAGANLTPDPSGVPYYDEALFKTVLHTCKVGARELNPIMPCEYFKGLTDEDVSAIFAFLRGLPPVAHNVGNVDAPTPCPRCGQPHGLGDRNEPAPPAR
jgi:mono/diheme cytochrome c family protein